MSLLPPQTIPYKYHANPSPPHHQNVSQWSGVDTNIDLLEAFQIMLPISFFFIILLLLFAFQKPVMSVLSYIADKMTTVIAYVFVKFKLYQRSANYYKRQRRRRASAAAAAMAAAARPGLELGDDDGAEKNANGDVEMARSSMGTRGSEESERR